MTMTETVLAEAMRLVDGARNRDYGDPKDNHARTAAFWSTYLGIEITPRQVCMLNILQKISRDIHRTIRDNLVDISGYARNAEIVTPESSVRPLSEGPPLPVTATTYAVVREREGSGFPSFEMTVKDATSDLRWKKLSIPDAQRPFLMVKGAYEDMMLVLQRNLNADRPDLIPQWVDIDLSIDDEAEE